MEQKGFGTWPSPISAESVAAQGVRLGSVAVDGDEVYWLERRPNEGGRSALVRCRADGRHEELTPQGFNVRTRVHEYGGGAYVVAGGAVYFSNFGDQRLYRVGGSAFTPASQWFYADFAFDAKRNRLICVREDHGPAEAGHYETQTTLVAIPLDRGESAGEVIASGYDFYSTPRVSPDGMRLAWLAWRHPQMPWNGTELWVADIAAAGSLERAARVAGGRTESIYQPGWSPDGTLYFVSDRDGWWKLYRWDGSLSHAVITNAPPDAEFGRPQWIFETATWAFADASRVVVSYTRAGRWHLGVVDVASGVMSSLAPGLEPREWLTATATHAIVVAGSARTSDAVMQIHLDTGEAEPLKTASSVDLDAGFISEPDAIEFPTGRGLIAHAFVYPPRHPEYTGAPGERPPLIVISHGGPTTATTARFDVAIQYWTTRGFAVADVNYGGSSGYGRPYRDRLNGQWGIVDVEDAVNAARYLVGQDQADPRRLIIRGGSAGGYTALAALVFHPGVFKAAASYYGVSDIEVLAHDTHKFESRYLDTLIGPYPELRELYRARSPIHFVDRLSCALILFQGLEDKVVPPNQSEMMADAVRRKGLPVAYLSFEGEQHGFRKASTMVRRTGLDQGVADLRIAYSPNLGYAKVDPELAAIVKKAVWVFEDLGAKVEEKNPGFEDPAPLFMTQWFSGAAFLLRGIPREKHELIDPGLREMAAQGEKVTAHDILDAQLKRGALGAHMNVFHRDYDLLVTPTLSIPAFDAGKEVADKMLQSRWTDWTPFTFPFNLTQQPAASIPCGLTAAGLPVGLHLVGPKYADALVLRAARAFETARPIRMPTL